MLLGPIFSFEIVTMARRARYFVLRTVYGLALLAALWIGHLGTNTFGPTNDLAATARRTALFFAVFSFIQVIAVLLVGPAIVAGVIATERQRRTIEYLFAARISGFEIVLGKLGARLLQIAALLLIGLPILAMAMLCGGIAPEALVVVYIITISTVLLVAAVSIAVSVWCRRANEAVTTAYVVLLAMLFVPMVAHGVGEANPLFYATWIEPINSQLLMGNPLWVLSNALTAASGATPKVAWSMVGALARNQLIVAAAAVLWAGLAVRRVHMRQLTKAAANRQRRFQLVRPTIGDRPMVWKELFAAQAATRLGLIGRLAVVALLLCAVGPAIYGFFTTLQSTDSWAVDAYQSMLSILSTVLACGMLLLLAAAASRSITAEKERQTWDSLLGTPLESLEIILGKIAGNLYSVRGGIAVLVALGAMGAYFDLWFAFGAACSLAMFALLAMFVTVVGLSYSLHMRSSISAMGATLGTCLFVGGGYLFCCVPLAMASSGAAGGEEMMLAPCIPFLLAFPCMCVADSGPPDAVVAAMVIGLILYAIATGLLLLVLIDSFNRCVGRAMASPEIAGARREPRRLVGHDGLSSISALLATADAVSRDLEPSDAQAPCDPQT